MQRISILCTDHAHPVNPWLVKWADDVKGQAVVEIVRDFRDLSGGDFLFLISCHQIVGREVRDRYRHTLVLHASELPAGRGMSPHIWAIVNGADEITITLLNAEDALDSGDIWQQRQLRLDGTELYDEINGLLFDAEVELMNWALAHCDLAEPRAQQGDPSYHRRRSPADNEIDPFRPLADSFNLLRVADPVRYPAFFELGGQKYRIRIEKM